MAASLAEEETPLLTHQRKDIQRTPLTKDVLVWIEIAIMANVFLAGFDGTITASSYTIIGSDFNASNTISWITTSYLLSSTAVQPLYGSFSDILGCRACLFFATMTFALGCLGCGFSSNLTSLTFMRALTGIGGGGLMTMATIINSDIITPKQRGIYQALQNALHGFGAICGASLGGTIAESIGWRYCFLVQIPVSALALVVGYFSILPTNEAKNSHDVPNISLLERIDIIGAVLLVIGLSLQLLALSLGGNEYSWTHPIILSTLVVSFVCFYLFFLHESRTTAVPILPIAMLKTGPAICTLVANIFIGMTAYAFLFMLPLFFQVVHLDSASQAGLRLVVPSIATPVGGLIAGICMSRDWNLIHLIWIGLTLVILGNTLVTSFRLENPSWTYFAYLVPGNLGQGIAYPSILFAFIRASSKYNHGVATSVVYLSRSMGTVLGVAISSSIIQNYISLQLPKALDHVAHKEEIIYKLRYSLEAIRYLSPEVQKIVQQVYFHALRIGFSTGLGITALALIFSIGIR